MSRRGGFTLLELVFAVEVMLLLTLIAFSETRRVREHALVAACLHYQASLQRNLWGQYAESGLFPPDIVGTLATMPQGKLPKTYDYAQGGGLAESYYLRCSHDHAYVAVLFCDSGSFIPPKAIYVAASARGAIP